MAAIPSPPIARSTASGTTIARAKLRARPYDIPLRALITRDTNGLLKAGRCINGDFIARSSYRVTGCAVATGHAAGVTAALAAQTNSAPDQAPPDCVKTALNQPVATAP